MNTTAPIIKAPIITNNIICADTPDVLVFVEALTSEWASPARAAVVVFGASYCCNIVVLRENWKLVVGADNVVVGSVTTADPGRTVSTPAVFVVP